MPLVHPPGHAQADFGEAIGIIGGVERKIHFFAFDLPHSDACFVVGYPAETTEAFCDGVTVWPPLRRSFTFLEFDLKSNADGKLSVVPQPPLPNCDTAHCPGFPRRPEPHQWAYRCCSWACCWNDGNTWRWQDSPGRD